MGYKPPGTYHLFIHTYITESVSHALLDTECLEKLNAWKLHQNWEFDLLGIHH